MGGLTISRKGAQFRMCGHKNTKPGSFVVTKQLQNEWDRRYRADRNQRPADCAPLFTAQLFRKQQRDSGAKHCTRAGNETDLRNRDFVLFHQLLYSF